MTGIAAAIGGMGGVSTPMSVSASPSWLYASVFNGGPVTSPTTTVSVTGGTSPFTYAWAITSGSDVTILSPSSASTQFRSNTSASSIATCTVTDAIGRTAAVSVSIELAVETLDLG